jgi:hypothetical protein
MAWKQLTLDEARQHPRYGFGGWMWVIYGLAVIGVISNLWLALGGAEGMVDTIVAMYGEEYMAFFQPFAVIIALVWAYLIYLAAARKQSMPSHTLIGVWAMTVVTAASNFYFMGIGGQSIASGILGLIYPALVSWYIVDSDRVNVTYRHRMREAEDSPAT